MALASHCSGISPVQSFYFLPSLDVTPSVHLPCQSAFPIPFHRSLLLTRNWHMKRGIIHSLAWSSLLHLDFKVYTNIWHFLWEPVPAVWLCFCQTYGICHFEKFQERKASPYSEPSGNTTFINDYNKSVSALPLCFYLQTSQSGFLWEANSQLTYSRREYPGMLSKASSDSISPNDSLARPGI